MLGRPAGVMGILNVTPDSFSDGGRHLQVDSAVTAGLAMARAGAAWIDVGGESSRPGAQPVPVGEELARVVPVLTGLRRALDQAGLACHLSIDTTKAVVAEAALEAGAILVNDIGAGRDPAMFPLIARRQVAVCLMHMRGQPSTMQDDPRYADVVGEVITVLGQRLAAARAAGIAEDAVLVDPGIGFGKTADHNWALLANLDRLGQSLGRPVLVGVSRKRLLTARLGEDLPPPARDADSHLLHVQLAWHCELLRVHDVGGTVRALRLAVPQEAS